MFVFFIIFEEISIKVIHYPTYQCSVYVVTHQYLLSRMEYVLKRVLLFKVSVQSSYTYYQ